MTRSHHGSICFACGKPLDHAGLDGILADVACIKCKERTRLMATDVEMLTLLDSNRPYPLEGSGLNVLLNPVVIDGTRAWADFAAGGFAVLREHRRSADWFDFRLQHVEPGPAALRSIRERGGPVESPFATVLSVMQQLAVDGKAWDWDSPANCLMSWWTSARAGAVALEAVGPIRTNEDAWAAAEALAPPGPVSEGEWTEMVHRLIALASAT